METRIQAVYSSKSVDDALPKPEEGSVGGV